MPEMSKITINDKTYDVVDKKSKNFAYIIDFDLKKLTEIEVIASRKSTKNFAIINYKSPLGSNGYTLTASSDINFELFKRGTTYPVYKIGESEYFTDGTHSGYVLSVIDIHAIYGNSQQTYIGVDERTNMEVLEAVLFNN